jgi:hypothetical protein
MRRHPCAAALFALAVLAAGATRPGILAAAPHDESEVSWPPIGKVQAWINTIGFLTIGPSAGLSFMAWDNVAVGVLARARGLGLTTHLATLSANEPSSEVDFQIRPYSVDASLEASYFLVSPGRDTAVRLGLEGGIGLAWRQFDYPAIQEYFSRASYDGFGMLLLQGAFRWRYPSGFFLEFGGRVGIQVLLWEASWYLDSPRTIYRSSQPELYPAGSLDFTMGMEWARR